MCLGGLLHVHLPCNRLPSEFPTAVYPPKDHLMKFFKLDFHTISIKFLSIKLKWHELWSHKDEGLYSDRLLKALSFSFRVGTQKMRIIRKAYVCVRVGILCAERLKQSQQVLNAHPEQVLTSQIPGRFTLHSGLNKNIVCVSRRNPVATSNAAKVMKCLQCEGLATEGSRCLKGIGVAVT